MMRSNVASEADFDRLEVVLIQKYSMEGIGKADDVANAVLFLTSDQAAYVNGALFAVDDGQSA